MRTRASSTSTSRAARNAPGVVAVYTGADIDSLQPTPVRLAAAQRQPQGREISVRCHATSSATSATSWPWSSPRRRLRPTTPLELVVVDYEPLPCVLDPQKASQPGAPQLHDDVAEQHRVQVDRRRRRRRRGVREGRSRRQGTHRPAASDPDGDGAARGVCEVGRRLWRAARCGTRRRIHTSCGSSPRW